MIQTNTNQCLFNCPNNSCNCMTSQNQTTQQNIYTCTCITGYKKISESPLACIDLHCETYTQNGYVYTCSKCEEGYILETDNTCKCDSGYIIKQTNPLKCAWDTFRCSNYTEGPSLYICNNCIEGYTVDISGRNCICAEGYVKVVNEPIECTLIIDNCISYFKLYGKWVCGICISGYKVDPYGKCLDCDLGYSIVTNNPFTCATEIYGCTVYSNYNSEWICEYCAVGYTVGCDGRCCLCNVGYIQVAQNPIVCILEIEYCIEYKLYDSIWGCGICEIGYDIDTDLKCNKCQEGYVEYSNIPLICISEIKNCDTYTLLVEGHTCSKCQEGYRICQGKCCECSIGYYVPRNNPEQCSECPSNCTRCRESENEVICTSCRYGYIVINGRCECDLEDFYMKGNSCVVKPLEVSLSYDYNSILVAFNKQISNSLTASDFIITFHEEFDSRLLIYEVLTIEDKREYLISFRFFMNINQVFSISITFSDKVTDRQNLGLGTKTQYTSLPLEVEGITARNEYCDLSCLECELVNGRLGCSICYDYAFIFEGLCKCYVETADSTPKSCPAKCPEGMVIDLDLRLCVSCKDCYEDNIEDDNNSQENSTEETVSKQEREYSDFSSSISTATSTSAFALGSTLGADKLWSLMNTMQIYSYLPLLQVEMPIYLQEALKSQDSSSKYFDYYKKYFPNNTKPSSKFVEFKYESSSFLKNTIKPITIISGIFLLNILTYIINRISKGKLNRYSSIILNYFNFSIYLRYFIQIYMDILVPCTLQLIYVIYIQPSEDSSASIYVYILSILIFCIMILSPMVLFTFLYLNFKRLSEENVKKVWGTLYSEFRISSYPATIYYVIFFIRRICISLSMILLQSFPLMQVFICTGSCLFVRCIQVLLHLIIYRPYGIRVQNYMQVVNEVSISLAYTFCGLFYWELGIDKLLHVWLILSCVYFSYVLHLTAIVINFIKFIIKKIKACRARRIDSL